MSVKYSLWISSLALTALLLAGCTKEKISGAGEVVTVDRNAKDFYNVQISGFTNAFITSGNNFKVQVKGYENILPKFNTTVQNGTLLAAFDKNFDITNDNTIIYITMPSLTRMVAKDNCMVEISGHFIGMDVFTAEASGNSKVSFENGKTTNLDVTLGGAADFLGFGLSSENAIIHQNGKGVAEVKVSKKLNAYISGDGNIFYEGNPEVTKQINGKGNVIQK